MTETSYNALLRGMGKRFGLISIGSLVINAANFVAGVLIVKYYPRAEAGIIGSLLSMFAMMNALCDLGLRRGATLEIARVRDRVGDDGTGESIGAAFTINFLCSISFTFLVIAICLGDTVWIPAIYGDSRPDLYLFTSGVMIVTSYLVLLGVVKISVSVCEAFKRMDLGVYCSVPKDIFKVAGIGIVVVAGLSWHELLMVWSGFYGLAAVIAAVVCLRCVRRIGAQIGFSKASAASLWHTSLPFYAANVSERLSGPILVVLTFVGGSAEAAAGFFLLRAIGGIIVEIVAPFSRVLLPSLPDMGRAEFAAQYDRAIRLVVNVVVLGGAVFLLVMLFGGAVVLDVLSGSNGDYRELLPALLIIAVGSFWDCQRCVLDILLIRGDMAGLYAKLEGVRLLLLCLLGPFALAQYDIVGMAVVYTGAALILFLAKTYFINHRTSTCCIRQVAMNLGVSGGFGALAWLWIG